VGVGVSEWKRRMRKVEVDKPRRDGGKGYRSGRGEEFAPSKGSHSKKRGKTQGKEKSHLDTISRGSHQTCIS